MAKNPKNLEMGYLLDFYGEALTEKQREMLRQYYNDDFSLSEIGDNFGITRQGARDAIKHGESALLELEAKVWGSWHGDGDLSGNMGVPSEFPGGILEV